MTKIHKRNYVLIMRFFVYFLLVLLGLSCSGISKNPSSEERGLFSEADSGTNENLSFEKLSIFPDKELKQILIRGSYYPENPEEVKEIEEEYREEGRLKEGEILQEKYPWMYDIGKEKYTHTNVYYCYNEVKTKDRQRCNKDNFKVRVYNKEGEMIAEDCLRLQYPEKYDEEGRFSEEYLKKKNAPYLGSPRRRPLTAEEGLLEIKAVASYVPYNENNHEIHIVKLEAETETILASFGGWYIPKSDLTGRLYDDRKYLRRGYAYDPKIQCHISPGPM